MPFSRWIRDSDVSAGMNNARCSTTSLLHLLSSVICFSFHHNCHIWRDLHLHFQPFPPGLLPYANEVLLPPPPPRSPLGQPCSPSEQLTRSYHRALQKFLLLKFRRISRWGACKHLRWKWPSALTCTARYQVTGGRRAAIDTGWQLHPWLTGVIRRIRLTDKRADKAGDKLTNQDLVKEGIPFVLKRPVRNVWQNNPCSSTAALGCSLRYFQLVE